jgi:hypothetical protein
MATTCRIMDKSMPITYSHAYIYSPLGELYVEDYCPAKEVLPSSCIYPDYDRSLASVIGSYVSFGKGFYARDIASYTGVG